MSKTFAAIDFETANRYRSSVCSVGIVFVSNNEIVDSFYSLIHPTPDYYEFTGIHGLTKEHTRNAPLFPEVWARVQDRLVGLPLVAHNSPFDEGCLKAAFEEYDMLYPRYKFFCTLQASRCKLGYRLPNHKLDTVARYCGYDLRNHHNALADAEACARIAIELVDF